MAASDFETAYEKRLRAMRENAVDPLLPNYGKQGKASAYAAYPGGVATEIPPSAVTPQPQPMQSTTPPAVAPIAPTPPVEAPVQTPPQPPIVQPDAQQAAQTTEPTPAPVAAPASFEERTRLARVKMGLELPSATDPTELKLINLDRRISNIGPRNRRERKRLEAEYVTLKKSLQPEQKSVQEKVADIYVRGRDKIAADTLAFKRKQEENKTARADADRTLRQTLAKDREDRIDARARASGVQPGTPAYAKIQQDEEAKSLRKHAQQKELQAEQYKLAGDLAAANDERELARDSNLQADKLERMQKWAELNRANQPTTSIDEQGNATTKLAPLPNITGKAEVPTYDNPKNAEETHLKGAPKEIRAKYKPENVREAMDGIANISPEIARQRFDSKEWDEIRYGRYLLAEHIAKGRWLEATVAESKIEGLKKKKAEAEFDAALVRK